MPPMPFTDIAFTWRRVPAAKMSSSDSKPFDEVSEDLLDGVKSFS